MPADAADSAVPLPFTIPVTVVESVIAGVVVALATVPARPLADTTETEVTVPSGLLDHWNADPLHSRNVLADVGATMKPVTPVAV